MPSIKPTQIPGGDYYTLAQVAELRGIIARTVQQWIDKGWLPRVEIPGLGQLINASDLETFKPPKRGPKGPRRLNAVLNFDGEIIADWKPKFEKHLGDFILVNVPKTLGRPALSALTPTTAQETVDQALVYCQQENLRPVAFILPPGKDILPVLTEALSRVRGLWFVRSAKQDGPRYFLNGKALE